MKFLIVLVALSAVALSAPAIDDSRNAKILSYENDNDGLGKFNYAFETSDGTSKQEQGEVRFAGTENEAVVVRGFYSWIGGDGQQYRVNYIADENGFQPEGAHIQKSL